MVPIALHAIIISVYLVNKECFWIAMENVLIVMILIVVNVMGSFVVMFVNKIIVLYLIIAN